MPRPLPLHPGLGPLGRSWRPHTAPSSATHTSRRRLEQPWSRTHTGQQLTLQQVEPLIRSRVGNMKSAFMAVDPAGTGLVSKEEFRRVLESLLPVFKKQLHAELNQVCAGGAETVDYLQFLRSFGRAPAACRASSSRSSHFAEQARVFTDQGRRVNKRVHRDESCSEAEPHEAVGVQEFTSGAEIGGNLENMIRVFRLFDFNRGGRIQQHEFRRILDNYCVRLTDKEFQRLWSHYSPSNSSTVSYEVFLETLGFGDSHKISPICTKLEVCSRGKSPPDHVKHKKQTPGDPSVLPHRKLQTLFHDKMCVNSTSVWQALQAFDTTRSGLVTQEVLRAVLSSFIFPMNLHSFKKLTSRVSQQAAHDEDELPFQDFYPKLKEVFLLMNQLKSKSNSLFSVQKEAARVTRADLRHLLERPVESQAQIFKTRLRRSQITELLNVLDPEHTGIIQLADLERLEPTDAAPAPTDNTATPPANPNTAETKEVPKETKETDVEQKSSAEKPETTRSDDEVCVASASQRTDLLQEKLCVQLGAVLEALRLFDPQRSGNVTQEDLKTALSCSGMNISDTQLNKGRETLRAFNNLLHRPCASLDAVFQKMRLEQREGRLTDRIQTVCHSSDGTLSKRDMRKILEDISVILEDKDFNKFTDQLGFRGGRIESSSFLRKYEGATVRRGRRSAEGQGVEEDEVDLLLTTAQRCLAAMKTRIKTMHGDNLAAFRLMDRRRRGVVDCHDFKKLYDSLGFFCREDEYERLLDLIGLHPGGNLNYKEFVDVVENNGKRKQETRSARVQQQLHELLSSEARHRWTDMSKVLCQSDSDGQCWIHKDSLRRLLFTYSLPLTSEEFDRLWLRYDPEQRGRVAVCDFLEKLGFHHKRELRTGQNLNKAKAQSDHKTPVTSDDSSLKHIELNVSTDGDCERLSYTDFLSAFENKSEKKCERTPSSPDALRQIECLDDLSPGAALVRMRDLVTASALNLFKAFSAFDRGRTGTLPALEFRQVLESFCARLSDKQFRHILTTLELDRESCTVNWKDFLNKFQSKSPPISTESCSSRTRTKPPFHAKTPDITDRLTQTQEVVSDQLREINLDLDSSQSGPVSKEQLRQICDRRSRRLTDDQVKPENLCLPETTQTGIGSCLQMRRGNPVWSEMPLNGEKKLQHREFQKRFGTHSMTLHPEGRGSNVPRVPSASPEPRGSLSAGAVLQRTQVQKHKKTDRSLWMHSCVVTSVQFFPQSAPQFSSRRPASAWRPGTGSPAGGVERRLRAAVQRCWKEIQRSCREEDPQNEGLISTSCFLKILQSLSITVTQTQFELLAVKLDVMTKGCVSYHDFLRHFLLNLKPAETMTAFQRRKLPLPTQTSRGVLSRACVDVMLRIYDVVRSSWTSIRRCFLASDRARTGSVSVQDFRKVLRHFSVNLSEDEFFHLSSFFDADTTGKIRYGNFLWTFLH
ncbi:EF-hand calcium-binding domain-containing protein 6 [Labrus mixtus]|uniref:EF-hand calcium-binding domain-containing protein 6 n=1 Tax=Labrus mixtus TaxID=508554 RepID=UPI0029BFB363|nr:EF-hand calcium-binding domain-containing protein 6 [Labrus mixtus]